MKQILEDDLKWLIAAAIEVLYIQNSEYSNKPSQDDIDRILRIVESNEIAMSDDEYFPWIEKQKRR